jgi:FixJ family two-component response regulator
LTEVSKQVVYIVDDDPSVRKAMERLLRSAGLRAQTFCSAMEFLSTRFQEENSCLILDIKMAGLSGLELQKKLLAAGIDLPVIFITAFHNPQAIQEAKKLGAVGYFRKPIDDQALLDLLDWVFGKCEP